MHLKATDFRCLEAVEANFDPHYNLIYGANASGKTSLLEAISYLGRGKSFRGASTQQLIRYGCSEFVLLGRLANESRESLLGIRNSRDGLEIRLDGQSGGGAALLAESLPLQIIGPDVHSLVAGGPEERRRHLDWVAFHVEQGFIEHWRRFRRALKQRNAALRLGSADDVIAGWDKEFIAAALNVHGARKRVADLLQHTLEETGQMLLGTPVGLAYRGGWASEYSLEEALAAGLSRDRELGGTQSGPHRADLKLEVDEHQARKMVSRGQQKLLACALILGAAELAQDALERPLLLLLDDPAAELDASSLQRLMASVIGLGSQVVATALEPDSRIFPEPPALFHVERGALLRAD